MRVRFLKTVQYKSGPREEWPVYEVGSEHDFSEDFARRWLRRGAAKEVTENTAAHDEPVSFLVGIEGVDQAIVPESIHTKTAKSVKTFARGRGKK